MKMITCTSQSHRTMLDSYFMPSFREHLSRRFSLEVAEIPQFCTTGSYNSRGFRKATKWKLKRIIDCIRQHWDEVLVFADCDIQFFADFSEDLITRMEEYDIVFQDDVKMMCTGFMGIRCNTRALSLFEQSVRSSGRFSNDQLAVNHWLQRTSGVRFTALPRRLYFNIASVNGGTVWEGDRALELPAEMVLHHANWTVGIERKMEMMRWVRDSIVAVPVEP